MEQYRDLYIYTEMMFSSPQSYIKNIVGIHQSFSITHNTYVLSYYSGAYKEKERALLNQELEVFKVMNPELSNQIVFSYVKSGGIPARQTIIPTISRNTEVTEDKSLLVLVENRVLVSSQRNRLLNKAREAHLIPVIYNIRTGVFQFIEESIKQKRKTFGY